MLTAGRRLLVRGDMRRLSSMPRSTWAQLARGSNLHRRKNSVKKLKAAKSCFADQHSNCFSFPEWLGVCSRSQCDFLKFSWLQKLSLSQNHVGGQRSPSKTINKRQVGGSFSTLNDVCRLGRGKPAHLCKQSNVLFISDARPVLKDTFFTAERQVVQLTNC